MKNTRSARIAALFVAVLVIGSASSASALSVAEIQAQIQSLLGQIAALGQSAGQTQTTVASPVSQQRICMMMYRNLSFGSRGDDVVALQEFLRAEGYFSANATGYFGPMTAQAVAKWQASQGVSAVGSFGPMSRERVRLWCGLPGQGGGWSGCTKEYAPVCGAKPIVCITTPCNPIQQTYGNRCMMLSDGATYLHDGACRGDSGNMPPTISSSSGPTTLNVNQLGTWTIQASDPENGQLTYSITWGDEQIFPVPMASMAARESFVQTTTFTHTYNSAGTYTVVVRVQDDSGQLAQTTTSVRVGPETVYCTMEYAPVCGQPPEPACRHSIPACMMPDFPPQTYGNRCVMNAAGATFLYAGPCSGTY